MEIVISREFLIRLKLNDRNAYQISQEAGVNPVVLSRLIHGIEPVRPNDDRIIRVARVLGLSPEEAFTTNQKQSPLGEKG